MWLICKLWRGYLSSDRTEDDVLRKTKAHNTAYESEPLEHIFQWFYARIATDCCHCILRRAWMYQVCGHSGSWVVLYVISAVILLQLMLDSRPL